MELNEINQNTLVKNLSPQEILDWLYLVLKTEADGSSLITIKEAEQSLGKNSTLIMEWISQNKLTLIPILDEIRLSKAEVMALYAAKHNSKNKN